MISECVGKGTMPAECKSITNGMQYCSNGKKQCVAKFQLEGDQCLPQMQNLKFCPKGRFRVNKGAAGGRGQCECDGHFWRLDETTGTCSLAKTICSEGEKGDQECSARDAICRVNPSHIEGFECVCPPGKRYSDTTWVKSGTSLQEQPALACVDVCELPYRKSSCAAIGGRCNAAKLSISQNLTLPTNVADYCECVAGTFWNSAKQICEQKEVSFVFDLVVRWSRTMQEELGHFLTKLDKLAFDSFAFESEASEGTTGFEVYDDKLADSVGLAQLQMLKQKSVDEQTKPIIDEWTQQYRRFVLLNEARSLLQSAQLINDEAADVEALALASTDEVGFYSLRLAINVAHQGDAKEELTAKLATLEKECKDNEINVTQASCVIPYLRLVMKSAPIEPTEVDSCSYHPCQGMSDCHANGSSYFSCECNQDYFTPSSRHRFATDDHLLLLKNEQCRPKDLCSRCNREEKEVCHQEEARQDSGTGHWSRPMECVCQDGYKFDAKGKCVSLCFQQDDLCNGHGSCRVKGKDETVCRCDEDYYGEHCEHFAWSRTPWIISVAVLAALVIIFIILVICLYRR